MDTPDNLRPAGPMLDTVCEVVTPEGVALRLLAAGPFPRALAWLIDLGLRLSVLWLVGTVFAVLGALGNGVFLVVLFVLLWLYPVLFETLWNGQTPGKRALGLRVVAANGAPVGWMAAFVRNLLRAVDMLPVGYAVGLVSGLCDRWGRRLGDLVAGTLVVHAPRAPRTAASADIAPRAPVVALTPEEQSALVAFAERAPGLALERQRELAGLAQPATGQHGEGDVQAVFALARWLVGQRA